MKNIGEQEPSGLLRPSQDIVFQALFGTRGSEKFLGDFLSSILGEKVENVSLEANQNVAAENKKQKHGILDLRANVGDNTTVNIEVQMTDPKNMFKRLLWYWARIYGFQIKKSENYKILKKTISILIVNYDIKEFKDFEDAHTIWRLSEKRDLSLRPFEDIEIHVIELPKIEKYQYSTNKDLYTWLKFLSNPESEEVKMSKEKNENLKEAYSRLEFISGNIDLQREADLQLMAIMDEKSKNEYYAEKDKEFAEKDKEFAEKDKEFAEKDKEFAEKDKEFAEKDKEFAKKEKEIKAQKEKIDEEKQRILQEKQGIIKKMYEKGMSTEEIIEITNYSKEEIEKAINNN